MGKSKTIYRDVSSNRLITPQQAAKRDPDTWVEEVFNPNPESADRGVRELPNVEQLSL